MNITRVGPTILALALSAALGACSGKDGAGTSVTSKDGPDAETSHAKISFVRCETDGNCGVYTIDPDGTNEKVVVKSGVVGAGLAASPDGTKLAYVSSAAERGSVVVVGSDGKNPKKVGAGVMPTWLHDGSGVAFLSPGGDKGFKTVVAKMDGSGTEELGVGWQSTWSPDGKRVAFVNQDGLIVANRDGTGQRTIFDGGAAFPEWSPDGAKIVSTVGCGNAWCSDGSVQVLSPDGKDATTVFANSDGETIAWPSWSPDGSKIVMCAGDGILVVDADGSDATAVNDAEGCPPRWSPSGDQLIFTEDGGSSDDSNVWVVNADGSGLRSVGTGSWATWVTVPEVGSDQ